MPVSTDALFQDKKPKYLLDWPVTIDLSLSRTCGSEIWKLNPLLFPQAATKMLYRLHPE